MISFKSKEEAVHFYKKCQSFVRRKNYREEIVAEFPAWAILHATPTRARIDFLFTDYLRQELGTKGSERNLFLAGSARGRPAGGNDGDELHDGGLDIAVPPTQEASLFIRQCLSGFTDRDRSLLELHFLEGASLSEIGEELSISKSRAKQRLDQILVVLRSKESSGRL